VPEFLLFFYLLLLVVGSMVCFSEPELSEVERGSEGGMAFVEYFVSELERSSGLKDLVFELPKPAGSDLDPRLHVLGEDDYAGVTFAGSRSIEYDETLFGIEDGVDERIDDGDFDRFAVQPFIVPETGGDITRRYDIPVSGGKGLEVEVYRFEDYQERLDNDALILRGVEQGEIFYEMFCRRSVDEGWTYMARDL